MSDKEGFIKRLNCLLNILAKEKVVIPPNLPIVKPTSFDTCNPIDTNIPPQYIISYRNDLILSKLDNIKLSLNPLLNDLKNVSINLSLDISYAQTWNLIDLLVSDIASTITLAPNETLTLEFESSQRKVLEQSTMDSTESLNSNESLTNDKEIINVLRSTTKNSSWNVDGNASISIAGIFKIGGGGDVKKTLNENTQNNIEKVNEETAKSANSLKVINKIEVKGTSESIVKNRMQRIISNPYKDRTLSINVFQLMKKFSVETKLKEIRPALTIDIETINFDSAFIQKNSAFLRAVLLDTTLADQLDRAIEFITSSTLNVRKEALDNARLALNYIFEDFIELPTPPTERLINIFNMPQPENNNDSINSVEKSFDGTLEKSALTFITIWTHDDYLTQIFTIFNFFYRYYKDLSGNGNVNNISDSNVILFISSLGSKEIQELWQKIDSHKLINIMTKSDIDDSAWNYYLELVRRLPGFFIMVNQMIKPYMPNLELNSSFAPSFSYSQDDPKTIPTTDINELKYSQNYYTETQSKNIKNSATVNAILKHLNCNKNYYIQQYLKYLKTTTHSSSIINLSKQIITDTFSPSPDQNQNKTSVELILSIFDIQQIFINKQQLIIPAYKNASENTINKIIKLFSNLDEDFDCDNILADDPTGPNFKFEDVIPETITVDVPTDGIHMEAVAGECILKGLSHNKGKNCTPKGTSTPKNYKHTIY